MKNARLKDFAFWAFFAALAPAPAFAQDAAGGSGSMVDTIEVVGNRPNLTNANAISPVSIVSAEKLARSGAVTLDDAFADIPALSFQGVSSAQNNGGFGAVFADLRNLNFNRTVTLVNGRRFVLSGISTDEAVDISNIPVSLIDHVEVLPDGSQPEYGADSVAGVINIVLKRDFEGALATAEAGGATRGDAREGSLALTIGHAFGPAHITFDLSHSHRDPLLQSRRTWARNPITQASVDPNGALELERGLTATSGGHAIGATADDLVLGPGQSRPFDPASDGYDFSRAQYLQSGLDRTIGTLLADMDFSPQLSAFAEITYARRLSSHLLAPQTLGLAGTALHPEGFVVPAANPFNFFGEDVTLARVLDEAGPLNTKTRADTFRSVLGLEGEWRGFRWTLSYNHGQVDQRFVRHNSINLTRAIETISGDPNLCIAAEGCVQADYFGPSSLSPKAIDFIRYDAVGIAQYREDIAQAAFDTTLFSLPAGDVELSLGIEHAIESGRVTPDAVTLAGDQAGSDAAPTKGRIVSDAVFTDLDLPLLTPASPIGALRADLGARYSRYDLFGSFPTWRANLTWAPTPDIRFRTALGAARRIPAITEAFGGSTSSFLAVDDPCDATSGERDNPVVDANCIAAGAPAGFAQASPLIAVANGGSTSLKPESSRNFSFGVVFAPRAAPNFVVTADYYRIRIKDAIDSLADTDPNFIPDLFAVSTLETNRLS